MNKIKAIPIVLLVISFAVLTGCVENIPTSKTTGSIIFTITDEAADMESINEIKVTTNSIRIHSESEGWITLSNQEKTYSLLELNSTSTNKLLASSEIDAGSYNIFRIDVKEVIVNDSSGEHEAKLPSGKWQINYHINVSEEANTTVMLDIQSGLSLHVTGNNKYIFAPVIHVESKENTTVSIDSENNVVVTGGFANFDATVGMNVNGEIGSDLNISPDANLSLDSEGSIGIGNGVNADNNGRFFLSITDDYANMQSVSNVEITFEKVKIYSMSKGWIELSDEEKTYDLIELKNQASNKIIVDYNIEEGSYSKIRLMVEEVKITFNNSEEVEATLPTNEWQINNTIDIENNKNTSVKLDFLANESLFIDTEGKYIFSPAINIETRNNAEISINENNKITISGGTISNNVKVAMSMNGNMGIGLGIDPNSDLTVGVDGLIDLGL